MKRARAGSLLLAIAAAAAAARAGPSLLPEHELRVCADPNNLPFSNRRLEGFENHIATIIAGALHAKLTYAFWPQRRGFLRYTMKAGRCDVVLGVPEGFEPLATTRAYYRSSYAFVYRVDRGSPPRNWDDPRLSQMRIGVQLIGDDYANTPPAHFLQGRGLGGHIVGFTVYGDYAEDVPQAPILDAVARGDIDLAIVWGPLAGYGTLRDPSLALSPVPDTGDPATPMTFAIAMGVNKGDDDLARALDRALATHQAPIDAVLRAYRVPTMASRNP